MILIFVFAMIYKIAVSDCNGTNLVCKRTLNHLARQVSLTKWLSVRLRNGSFRFESYCIT